jgi:hypothetical protein
MVWGGELMIALMKRAVGSDLMCSSSAYVCWPVSFIHGHVLHLCLHNCAMAQLCSKAMQSSFKSEGLSSRTLKSTATLGDIYSTICSCAYEENCILYRKLMAKAGSVTAISSPSLINSRNFLSRFGRVCSSKLGGA